VKNRTRRIAGVFLVCLGLCTGRLAALEQEIVLGREEGWRDFPGAENLVRRTGMWNTLDFFLRENEYLPVSGQTDLLLHFNRENEEEASGHYRLDRGRTLIAPEVRVLGEASAGFNGDRRGLQLSPQAGALFERGTRWGDFSIEFWLRPTLLSDGEEVLAWIGSFWRDGRVAPQELRCAVRSRRLAWEFVNLFAAGAEAGEADGAAARAGGMMAGAGGQPSVEAGARASTPSANTPSANTPSFVIRVEGLTPLVPRIWRHHLLRFDSGTGLLEYLVDGIPEAVTYVRAKPGLAAAQDNGPPLTPYTGEADSAPLSLGRGFTGFLDELRISRLLVEDPVLARYDGRAGVATSTPLDLGYTGTRLKRIEAVYSAQGDSDIFFYYRLADRLSSEQLDGDWVQFQPGAALEEARGRYVQLRAELFPDGRRSLSPQLSELRVVYEQDLPPAAPAGVQAVAGNARVRLHWSLVREEDVRGYLVYYGLAPGNYRGTGADRGPSPIDVGPATELELKGLENGRLYYFAVVSYDATQPPHRSAFSREVSARPSGALR
jgi:hypothetical protein